MIEKVFGGLSRQDERLFEPHLMLERSLKQLKNLADVKGKLPLGIKAN